MRVHSVLRGWMEFNSPDPKKVDAFLAWVAGLPNVLNPAPVIRWNADKRYLRELADAGLPVVPTTYLEPGDPFTPPNTPFVVKPAVGAGSKDSARYKPGQSEEAIAHVRRKRRNHRALDLANVMPTQVIDRIRISGVHRSLEHRAPL